MNNKSYNKGKLQNRKNKKTIKKQGLNKKKYNSCDQEQNIVGFFLQMLNTVKMYHWRTTDYGAHKATDQLYADLNLKIDQFVEVLLGKNNRLSGSKNIRDSILNIKSLKLGFFNNPNDFKKEIINYKSILMNFNINKFNPQMTNSDLNNIRDEILAILNQFLYLLELQ